MPNVLPEAPPVNSSARFEAVVAWLPEMLSTLLASSVYNAASRPPADQRGVYLFSEGGQHLYVGRTSITARSRRGEAMSSTSFRSRFDQHTQEGRPPGTAPFANRLLHERAAEENVVIPADWWKKRQAEAADIFALFCEQKERLGRMEFRVCAFEDDARGVISTLAEVYVHSCLRTPYNDFSTS